MTRLHSAAPTAAQIAAVQAAVIRELLEESAAGLIPIGGLIEASARGVQAAGEACAWLALIAS